jgi:hypothetical protein
MEQNTNFKVGDIVAVDPKQMKGWKGEYHAFCMIEAKILKITPKRFLVQALGSCESCSDSEEEETYKETASKCPPVYVKYVQELI